MIRQDLKTILQMYAYRLISQNKASINNAEHVRLKLKLYAMFCTRDNSKVL